MDAKCPQLRTAILGTGMYVLLQGETPLGQSHVRQHHGSIDARQCVYDAPQCLRRQRQQHRSLHHSFGLLRVRRSDHPVLVAIGTRQPRFRASYQNAPMKQTLAVSTNLGSTAQPPPTTLLHVPPNRPDRRQAILRAEVRSFVKRQCFARVAESTSRLVEPHRIEHIFAVSSK